jgi:hypothetical protein
MSPHPIPPATTLIIRGGRAVLADNDWHAPEAVDIAVAGTEIATVVPSLAEEAGARSRSSTHAVTSSCPA